MSLFHNRARSSTALTALVMGVNLFAFSAPLSAQTILPPVKLDGVTDDADQSSTLGASVLGKGPLRSKIPGNTDTASLLDGQPGVGLYSAGGFSSLPTLRGLNDDRINTLVDGVPLIAACPNHMNPALSYVQPATVQSVEVIAGVTPVSKGGDSIAGTIEIVSNPPQFAKSGDIETHGSLSSFYKSVNRSFSLGGNFWIANDWANLTYNGSGTYARDYKDANNSRVASSSYKGQNHDIKIALRNVDTLVELAVGLQDVPYEGFSNQFMDMLGNQSRYANAHYLTDQSWGQIDAKAYWRYTAHFMDFLPDRYTTSDMPMDTKQQEAGYAIKADLPLSKTAGNLRVGNEYHYTLLRDWWPQGSGMMNPLVFVNLNNASRNRIGTFVEWEGPVADKWTALIGLRNDTIIMNTGTVQGYRTSGMGSSTYIADSGNFNALDRHRVDFNIDATALTRYENSPGDSYEVGYAHKTRSPNFYERYAWTSDAMGSDMINWFGDANGYVGSVSLRPEKANIVSATADWHDHQRKDWGVKLTPYYNYIRDYIGVNYRGSNSMMAPGSQLLQFANHDAMTYGIELSGSKALITDSSAGSVTVTGTSSFQRGYVINSGNSLYHMMPLSLNISLSHQLGGWSNIVEAKATASKSQADPLRNEPFTPGFAVVNFRTAYEWANLRLDAGIDNLLNQQYYSPLGGVDLADWKANGGSASTPLLPVAAPGRSYNAGFTVKF